VIQNNLTGGGNYALYTPSGKWSDVADPTTSTFTANVVSGGADFAAGFPTGNSYPASFDAIGLAGGSGAALSVTASPSSLALASSSVYKGKATDGTDIGAAIDRILAAVANVIVP
jgi:hypothetical protein